MKLLFIATVVLGAVFQLVHADSCTYADCVFQGIPSRYSGTEALLVYLNMTKIPDDVAQQCAILVDRAAQCEREKAGCSTQLEEDWENRMYDSLYVIFIMSLGNDYCKQPDKLFALRDCFTVELQKGVQSCIHGHYDFDFDCIRDQYESRENCPAEADAIFYNIVNQYLILNPYIPRY